MKTEYQKMLAGELYDAEDDELMGLRIRARTWMRQYNQADDDKMIRALLLKQLFKKTGNNVNVRSPVYIDYGCHIEVGNNFYANFNCVLLDCNYIIIGDNVFLGPAVQIYTADHPVMAADRILGPELAAPVTIGNNVWIGGGSIICAGVTIGANSTIGAGSVVVKDIPADVVAVGNPCKVIKQLR
jgi:maltose O-acetyltransferase